MKMRKQPRLERLLAIIENATSLIAHELGKDRPDLEPVDLKDGIKGDTTFSARRLGQWLIEMSEHRHLRHIRVDGTREDPSGN